MQKYCGTFFATWERVDECLTLRCRVENSFSFSSSFFGRSFKCQNTKSHLLFKLTMKASFSRTILTFMQGKKETLKSQVSGTIISKLLVCHFISTLQRTKNSCHHGWLLSDTKMELSPARIHPRIPSLMVTWIQNLGLQLLLVTNADLWVGSKESLNNIRAL